MKFDRVLYAPAYRILGVQSVLNVEGTDYPVKARDLTAGFVLPGAVETETELPMASFRAADIAALGLTADQLDGGTLLMNSVLWRIPSHRILPSPNGDGDGEVYLILEAA